jgi:uncharacterized protein (TIGR00725 family)
VIVSVVGKGRDCPAAVAEMAHNAGWYLRRRGHTVVTGGLGGVMQAALQGAEGEGVAVTPYGLPALAPARLVVRTGLPFAVRNVVTASMCDAMIALPGSHGTWQEVAVALERGVPVVLLGDHGVSWPGAVPAELVSEAVRILEFQVASRGSTAG